MRRVAGKKIKGRGGGKNQKRLNNIHPCNLEAIFFFGVTRPYTPPPVPDGWAGEDSEKTLTLIWLQTD